MRTPPADRVLLGAALVAALTSGAWFAWQMVVLGRSHRSGASGVKRPAAYVPAPVAPPVVQAEPWTPPPAQTKGPGWVYDVFTPPEIFYNARSGKFAVTAPGELRGTNGPAGLPGLELVEVKRELFRLQLVGYFGGGGTSLGAFENPFTSEVHLAGAGRRLPDLDLVVTDLAVPRSAAPRADGAAAPMATATVRDLRTGRSYALTAGERTFTDELYAVLVDEEDAEAGASKLRRGDELQRADIAYRIERLQLDPPSAELVQIAPVPSQPIQLSLAPRAPRDQPPAPPTE